MCERVLSEAGGDLSNSRTEVLSSRLQTENADIESKNLSVQVYRDGKISVSLKFPSKPFIILKTWLIMKREKS